LAARIDYDPGLPLEDRMAIRIRKIKGYVIALCAAKTRAKKGDIYLDDNAHHALTNKFAWDWYKTEIVDKNMVELMIKEESKEE